MLNKELKPGKYKENSNLYRVSNGEDMAETTTVDTAGLEDSHRELMLFFNAMDEVFFSVDMINQKVIQISNACEKLYGYKPEDFLDNQQLWFELIHPDDKPAAAELNKIFYLGAQVSGELRVICKDNSVKWIERKISPTLDKDGKLIRIDGITRDITARKESDEMHRESEERYRQIVETAQEGIWTIDEQEKTNFVNQKICDILGYSSEEMLGKGLYDFMDDEGRAYAIACMERRRNGVKENLDIRYVTKNGEQVWANISANPIFDYNGKYKGSLAMVTDITGRKLDEQLLKKSEANLRTIFDNTNSAYVLFGDDLKIMSFNALAQRYSEEQNDKSLVVGKPVNDYFSSERWPFVQKMLQKVIKDGTADYEISYVKKDGTVKWHNIKWLIVKNNDEQKYGFILANTDITNAKMAALEREQITADLIQHNKDLEQFTYIISHNLRAPVANILGLTSILKEEDIEDDERNHVIERVSASIKNVDDIIQDLNLILQVRKPVNEIKELVDFASLVDSIKTSIYDTIVKENVQLNCCFEAAECIFTIRTYLYSIFYNLTSNSIKYRQSGISPVIDIKTQRINDKMEICFKDNGKGIDLEKNASQLFGLYKRFDTSVEGKGMGLFMVQTQVEALGGTIKVKSKVGEGTEFIIQLPL